ncbi:MAG: hypothetical protein M3449_09015 [Acidobacteriota bacterium]|nr:hypothetical protein [Acidobacteriota bacterium]
MDYGWTLWFVEKNPCVRVSSVRNSNIRLNIEKRLETIIFPDQSPNQILNGYAKGSMPDEYTGGVGKEGVENLRKFVEAGGTLVFLNLASNFAIEQFNLPVRDVTKGLPRKDFFIPGSILRTELDLTHPIAKGMPKESIAWFENSPAYEIIAGTDPAKGIATNSPPCLGGVPEGRGGRSENSLVSFAPASYMPSCSTTPSAEAASTPPNQVGEFKNVRIIARYPSDPKNVLLSGWALGAEKIAGKAALVEFTIGKGKIVLFGFRPQYRGQSLATFPLLFNAIAN